MKALDKISVEGFKSIRELKDFPLESLNVLIGANGSGKSNFILLFKMLNSIVNGNLNTTFLSTSGRPDALLYFGRKKTEEIDIEVSFERNGYRCKLIPTVEDTLIFGNEECWFTMDSGDPFPVEIGKGYSESKLESKAKYRGKKHVETHVFESMKDWRVYHFHDTSRTARVRHTGKIDDARILHTDAGNLAAFLYMLREKHFAYYQNIIDTIRLVAPFFDDFVLSPSSMNSDEIQLRWRHLKSDIEFGAGSLSDGTLRFICLATLLMQPQLPTTIILDEPELGLHPYAISVLSGLFKSVSVKNQLIVSTQSVTLVNQMEPEDIILVDRVDDQSVFKRPSAKEMEGWLEDYALGDLWEKNLIGGARP